MAKKVADVESGAGVFAAIVAGLVSRVNKLGGDIGADFHRLAKPEGESILDELAALIVQAGKPIQQLAENYYKVLVDYGQTLQQMIANGKYDYANSDITSGNFPMTGNGKQEVVVEFVHYGCDMATDDVLKDLESKGMRPAILPELLAFGATYPEKQRKFPIVALGSVWRARSGGRGVPYLGGDGSGRELFLGWGGSRWYDYCRFAAVRK